jgi:superfamily I DNA/RNA helicase
MTPNNVPPELSPADAYPMGPGRVVLIGPPGCGKTRAALEHFLLPVLRACGLPEREPGQPLPAAEVLGVSFSRAAAGEIRARLARELGGRAGDYRATARTVHSEALALLRGGVKLPRRGAQEDDEDGLPEAGLGAEEAIGETSSDRRRAAVRLWDLARHRLERGDLRPAYALARPVGFELPELEAEVRAYEREKRSRGERDFTDLLELALDVDPPARELVLVDEAQDTSRLQWALLERWAAAAERFVVIGDPDQAIHRWCGACPERLLEHARTFAVRRLGRSHRVPRAVHALARPLILLNRGRLDAPYAPAAREGRAHEADAEEAVRRVVEVASAGHPLARGPEEPLAMILGRSRAVLGGWATSLAEAAVPFANERGYSPLNGASRRAIARAVLELRTGEARLEEVKALLGALPASCFPPRQVMAVRKEVGAWRGPRVTLEELAVAGLRVDGLRAPTLRAALLVAFARRPERDRVAADLDALVARHGPAVLDRAPRVVLTTAHGAKGREAPLVVVDLELPRQVLRELAEPGAADLERQLLYVAITRPIDELILVRHGRRDLGAELGLEPIRSGGPGARGPRALSCPDTTDATRSRTFGPERIAVTTEEP